VRISHAVRTTAALSFLFAIAAPALAEPAPLAIPVSSTASARAADCYGSTPRLALAPLEIQVLAAARAGFPGPPAHAPELSLAAREIAARLAAGERDVLGRRALRLALARACAADPAASVLAVSAAPSQLVAQIARELQPGDFTHLGVGVVGRGRFAHAVLIGSRRAAELAPFPREVAAGSGAQLRGRLLGLEHSWAVITGPDGLTRQLPIDSEAAGFAASVAFESAGRYLVEVGGGGPHGPEVAALLVVAAGGASLDEGSRPLPQPDPGDAAEAEARVVAAVNAVRRLHALGPLEVSEPVRALARQYSAEMLRQRMVAHVLPGGALLSERLDRGGIAHERALENLAVGESAMAAHESLEESPAHLANLLDRALTQLGVGLARGTSSTGEPAVYLTEILLTPAADEIEPVEQQSGTPEAQVKEALRRERARLGRRPLRADRRLDEIAAKAAGDMLRSNNLGKIDLAGFDLGHLGEDVLPHRAAKQRARLLIADAFATSAPARAARSPHVGDARFQWVGVGVAVAGERQPRDRRFWIAVIYSD
jgi:uncharacterized protein YkwD